MLNPSYSTYIEDENLAILNTNFKFPRCGWVHTEKLNTKAMRRTWVNLNVNLN